MHDPSALRITAHVPQSMAQSLKAPLAAVSYEVPGVTALASPQAQEAQENGWDLETPMPDYDLDDEIDEYEEGENG
jgi:hypothetical protein